jgi:hypothetical protein
MESIAKRTASKTLEMQSVRSNVRTSLVCFWEKTQPGKSDVSPLQPTHTVQLHTSESAARVSLHRLQNLLHCQNAGLLRAEAAPGYARTTNRH